MMKAIKTFLVTFPCAGGGAMAFNEWQRYFASTQMINIEYSGHWTRIGEPFMYKFDVFVDDVYEMLKRKISILNSVFLFGHSMGGMVAWHIASRLKKDGFKVAGLIISACAPPGSFPGERFKEYKQKGYEVFLRDVSNIPQRIINSVFFIDNIFPMLEADFKVISDYRYEMIDKNDSFPISVFYGEKDPIVSYEDLLLWKNYCSDTDNFIIKGYKGDHNYLRNKDCVKEVCRTVAQIIDNMAIR